MNTIIALLPANSVFFEVCAVVDEGASSYSGFQNLNSYYFLTAPNSKNKAGFIYACCECPDKDWEAGGDE